jgi:hypothetical protein
MVEMVSTFFARIGLKKTLSIPAPRLAVSTAINKTTKIKLKGVFPKRIIMVIARYGPSI